MHTVTVSKKVTKRIFTNLVNEDSLRPYRILRGFLFYIMITKFNCIEDIDYSIEFQREENTLIITIKENQEHYLTVILNEENLFSLIGQLLRIQSDIRKWGNNE